MNKKKLLIFAGLLLCSILAWFFLSPHTIGQVNKNKTDDEAIKEVVTTYFKKIKNYTWKSFDKEKGLNLWTKEGKEEMLNNPDKLPSLEQSIKENKISRKLITFDITELKLQDNKAEVMAITIEESSSENKKFNGTVKTYETLTLIKENNLWRIQKRDAISMLATQTK